MTKILLVDERKDICNFIVRFFRERNFEVLNATNGMDAVRAVKKEHPDIVLLELKMPDMDGLDILKRIKEVRGDARVIALTSVDDRETMFEAMRLGVVSYLTKPVVLGELVDVILANLGRRKRFFKLKRIPANV